MRPLLVLSPMLPLMLHIHVLSETVTVAFFVLDGLVVTADVCTACTTDTNAATDATPYLTCGFQPSDSRVSACVDRFAYLSNIDQSDEDAELVCLVQHQIILIVGRVMRVVMLQFKDVVKVHQQMMTILIVLHLMKDTVLIKMKLLHLVHPGLY